MSELPPGSPVSFDPFLFSLGETTQLNINKIVAQVNGKILMEPPGAPDTLFKVDLF